MIKKHKNLFLLEEFENLFIHRVIDKQYAYLWPLKIKLSIFSQSQFYLLCAGHLRLKKLLPIYTWDSILIFKFIWQLMASIPQPWSFTWKLELWHPISFLVLFQKVYTRIRWDNLLPSNLGNNFELDMKFFWL